MDRETYHLQQVFDLQAAAAGVTGYIRGMIRLGEIPELHLENLTKYVDELDAVVARPLFPEGE